MTILPHEGLSCDPRRLYGRGGLREGATSFERLCEIHDAFPDEIEVLGELYPGSVTARPDPAYLNLADRSHAAEVDAHFCRSLAESPIVPPSLIVRIRRAVIWHNIVFVLVGSEIVPLYENYRPCDQLITGRDAAAPLRNAELGRVWDGDPLLFVGSAGSFNYGHWLIDDLPRYKALNVLGDMPVLRLAYARYAETGFRNEGLEIVAPRRRFPPPLVLDLDRPLRVDGLHYVTPVSYQPFGKNDAALEFLRGLGASARSVLSPRLRLFVNRLPRWSRNIGNPDDVVAVARKLGFVEIHPEDMTLRQQIEAFARAESVFGIMGAAMTNVVFAPRTTFCHYLSPETWPEPFFWDLTGGRPATYGTMFCTPVPGDAPIFKRSFFVDSHALEGHLLGRPPLAPPGSPAQRLARRIGRAIRGDDRVQPMTPA